MYNETALRHLNSRPQVLTLISLLLPLPDDPESTVTEASPTMEIRRSHQQAVQPQDGASSGDTGGVTNDVEPQDQKEESPTVQCPAATPSSGEKVRSHQQCSGPQ